KKAQSLLLSALIGLMGGAGLAWFFEYLDNTLKTPEEVERYLRLPNLGIVPDLATINGRRYTQRRLPYMLPQLPSSLAPGKGPVQDLFHHPFSVATDTSRPL